MRRSRTRKIIGKVLSPVLQPAICVYSRVRSILSRMYETRALQWFLRSVPARFVVRLAVVLYSLLFNTILPWLRRAKRRIRAFSTSKELLGWFVALLLCTLMGVCLGLSNYSHLYWQYFILTLAIAVASAFALLTLRNPLFGVIFWISCSPLLNVYAQFKFVPGLPAITGDRLCLLMLAVALVLWARRPSKARALPGVGLLVGLFLLAMVPAMVRADEIKTAAQAVTDSYLAPMMLFFYARRWVQDKGTLQKSLTAILIVGIYLAVLGIPEYFTHRNFFTFSGRPAWVEEGLGLVRIQGPCRSPAEYGLAVALASYLAIILAVWEKNQAKRVFYIMLVGLFSVIIYMTLRRGVYMGWIAGMLVLLVASPRARRVIVPGLIVSAILCGVFFNKIINSPVFTERITYKAPVYQRLVLNATSTEIVKHHPWFGLGIGKFPEAVASYITSYKGISAMYATGLPSPHNTYFRILTEAGFIAFTPFAMIVLLLFYHTYKAYRKLPADGPIGRDVIALFWAFAFAHITQAGSTDAFLYCPYLNALFFFLAGAINGTHIQNMAEEVPKVDEEVSRTRRLRSARVPAS